jgi:hypothetical protein
MANLDAAFKPRQLKDISVIFDKSNNGPEFRKCIQSFQFVPSVSVVSTTGGTPDAVYTDVSPATWQLQIKFLQDAESVGALTDYLILNAGKVKHVDFVPYGGTGWGADVVLPAPPIGGDMNAWLADTVTCGVRGVPARTVDDVATPQQ